MSVINDLNDTFAMHKPPPLKSSPVRPAKES